MGATAPPPRKTESPGLRGFRPIGAPRFELGTSSPPGYSERRRGLVGGGGNGLAMRVCAAVVACPLGMLSGRLGPE